METACQQNDNISVQGKVRYELIEQNEVVETSEWFPNLVMNADGQGINLHAQQLIGNNVTPEIAGVAIGTGTTQPTETDSDLENTTFETSFIAEEQIVGTDAANLQFFFTDSDLPDDSYTEFGLFTPPFPPGDLYSRVIFDPPIDKSSGQDVRVEYRITFNN